MGKSRFNDRILGSCVSSSEEWETVDDISVAWGVCCRAGGFCGVSCEVNELWDDVDGLGSTTCEC